MPLEMLLEGEIEVAERDDGVVVAIVGGGGVDDRLILSVGYLSTYRFAVGEHVDEDAAEMP